MKQKMLMLLASVLVIGTIFSGCGKEEKITTKNESDTINTNSKTKTESKNEPYTINYAFNVWVQQKDWDKVEKNVSDLVEKKIGAKVKLLPMTGANYYQQINLMITSGEKLDLYNTSARDTFSSDIVSNKIMGMDPDMVKEYAPDTLNALGDFMKATTIDNKIYGFPTIRDMADAYGFIIRDDLAQKYHVDTDETMKVEDIDKLFETLKASEPDMYVTQPQGQSTSILESVFKTYDSLGDDMGILLDQGKELKVENLFETDYYKQCLEKAREWNEKGYILPDASTNPDTGVAYFKTGKVATTLSLIHPGVPTDNTNMTGIKCDAVTVNPAFTNTQQVGAVIQSIPSTCKNPEKVLEFINLLYNDPEVYNALTWGIEGTHYKHVEDSDKWIDFPDGINADSSGYTLSATYLFGNRYLSYIWKTDPEDLNDRFEKFNDDAVKSKALGFTFNPASVKTESAAVQAVMDEYRLSLENGVIDPEENLPKFQKALKEAGIDKIISEKQKQLDEWSQK